MTKDQNELNNNTHDAELNQLLAPIRNEQPSLDAMSKWTNAVNQALAVSDLEGSADNLLASVNSLESHKAWLHSRRSNRWREWAIAAGIGFLLGSFFMKGINLSSENDLSSSVAEEKNIRPILDLDATEMTLVSNSL